MSDRWTDTITTPAQLRAAVPKTTSDLILNKDLDHLNDLARRFIALSPLVVISTQGADGQHDISPRGDPAGFVHVADDKTLLLPDRPGNTRLDGMENILHNPAVGLLFMVPGHPDTLRIAGTAQIIRDAAAQKRLSIQGRAPTLILAITVAQVFLHCSKAFVRSALWQPDTWPPRRSAPSLADWTAATTGTDKSTDDIQEIHDNAVANRLY